MKTCDNCGGEGGFYTPEDRYRWREPGFGELWDDCPECHGSGWVDDEPEPISLDDLDDYRDGDQGPVP